MDFPEPLDLEKPQQLSIEEIAEAIHNTFKVYENGHRKYNIYDDLFTDNYWYVEGKFNFHKKCIPTVTGHTVARGYILSHAEDRTKRIIVGPKYARMAQEKYNCLIVTDVLNIRPYKLKRKENTRYIVERKKPKREILGSIGADMLGVLEPENIPKKIPRHLLYLVHYDAFEQPRPKLVPGYGRFIATRKRVQNKKYIVDIFDHFEGLGDDRDSGS